MSQLPQGWEEKSVKDINHHKGKTIKPIDFPDETFELYSVPSFASGKPEIITGSEIGSSKQMVEPGDVLVCKINPRINRVWVVESKGQYRQIASSEWINVRNSNYDSRYLRYAFTRQAFRELICSEVSGVGGSLTRAQPKKVATYPVPVAPEPEQQRIADKLDSLLAKVEAAQARLDKIPTILKRFRKSVLAAATSGELTKDWRDENSDSVNTLAEFFIAEYDGKDLAELPQGWGYVSFKDAADIKSNLTDPKLTPDAIHLAPNHIEANTGKILELVTVEQDGVKSNKHQFYSGQIIYSKIRPYLNKVCAVDFEGLCSADMYPIEAKVNREYLLNVMLSDEFVNYTSQQQGRVVLPKINQKALNKIPVPVPPDAEQVEISRLTSELLAKAEVVEKQYRAGKARLDRLTQSILAKAFRGELLK